MSTKARTIDEVSDPFTNFMLNPAASGPGVCATCWTFNDPAYSTCYACGFQPACADAVLPITYSIGLEQMHFSLRNYKDGATSDIRDRFQLQLAAVLWRFLRDHEACVAVAAQVSRFDVVTVVPSGSTQRDDQRPRLRQIVGDIVVPTAQRFERVLMALNSAAPDHKFDYSRFQSRRPLDGESVLLIDDTWTTGASVQSAAYALKSAGAARVGVVVIGRHVNREFSDHGRRIKALPRPFDWSTCAVH